MATISTDRKESFDFRIALLASSESKLSEKCDLVILESST